MADQLKVYANLGAKTVGVVMTQGGMPIEKGEISFTLEQATEHAMGMITAIEMIKGRGKSGLIIPDAAGRALIS